ncbi:Insulinase (Peptidase M16) [Mortierella antarctica]|nr:Insulinase (Peptidase M16) [Mortierella antarctica]
MPNGLTLAEGYEPSKDGTHAVFTKPIESSQNDERSYRLIRLKNDLEVLLIHDDTADKSAAALDVHVGHLSDPDNLQGLAHFLEHLLFLGTAKYPRENEYKEFLSLHAGKSNASTSLDNTAYHFEVGHAFLEGALDRFAQFFISPNFDEDCKVREMRAVDSEFKRNLQQDQRRLFQIGKHLSSRQHPYWHFGTGNLRTLLDGPLEEGIDVREELIKFYHKYYSSSIMKLVILGREPLDQLSEWAVDKFSAIKNLGIQPPSYSGQPLTAKELLTMVYVKPVKEIRNLEIKFPFPDETRHYTTQPTQYISHLLRHEGSGSILSLLKKAGWANSISVGSVSGGIGFAFLKFTVDLTQDGLVHYEDIIVIVFQYIQMLRRQGVKSYIWDEIVSLASTAFRFKEMKPAAAYVVESVKAMQKGYAPEWILSGEDLVRDNNPDIIMEYMSELRTDNWRGLVVTQDQDVVPGGVFTETERWYGTEYHVEQAQETLLKRLENLEPHPDLHMPVPNEYIPKDFETHRNPTPAPRLRNPVLIKHTPLVRIWHKKDDVFWIPKVNMYFRLNSPTAVSSPGNLVKSMLYVRLVNDVLNEEAYSAELAGLSYSLGSTIDGIVLKVEGYHDKANLLLEKIVFAMRTLQVDQDRFCRIKDQLQRSHRNIDLENPNRHASYYMTYLNQERMWTYLERLQELDKIDSVEEIHQFYGEMLARLHIEALIHGNMDVAQATVAGEIVEKGLAPRALVASEQVAMRSVLLPIRCRAVYSLDTPDASNLNSGIEYYLQVVDGFSEEKENGEEGGGSGRKKKHRALVQILAQIIQEPCFNQLRTIEQLGYIVTSGVRQHGSTMGIKIAVQSERDPVHVEARIEEFLSGRIAKMLEDMSEPRFAKQVHSLVQKKLEKDKNLKEETAAFWAQITSGFYDFEEIQEDVEELEKITLEETRAFFEQWIRPGARYARKLSVHVRSQTLLGSAASAGAESPRDADQEVIKTGTVVIEDIVGFKSGLELSRAPCPVVDLLRYAKL